MRMVQIYTLSDPRTGEIRYVGKTISTAEDRFARGHAYDSGNSHKAHWVKQLKELGLKPVVEVMEIVSECDWVEAEKFWISTFRFYGFNLTNITNGGEGMSGWKMKDETRKKLSVANKGKVFSAEHRRNLSRAGKGKPLSEYHCRRMAEGLTGRVLSDAARKSISDGLTGRTLSADHRRRISESRKGQRLFQEHRAKIGSAVVKSHFSKGHICDPAKLQELQDKLS